MNKIILVSLPNFNFLLSYLIFLSCNFFYSPRKIHIEILCHVGCLNCLELDVLVAAVLNCLKITVMGERGGGGRRKNSL